MKINKIRTFLLIPLLLPNYRKRTNYLRWNPLLLKLDFHNLSCHL